MISDDTEQKEVLDHEFEEFELLEVDNIDATRENVDINKSQKTKGDRKRKSNDEITELPPSVELENVQIKKTKTTRTRSQRKTKHRLKTEYDGKNTRKSPRQAAKIELQAKKQKEKLISNTKSSRSSYKIERLDKPNSTIEMFKENEIKTTQLDCDDIAEGESDNEFPARDSDNEDWPSQEILNEFPKDIIKDGLLQVKGKELMSLICRYTN